MFTPSIVKLKEYLPDSQIDALIMFKGVKSIYEKLSQISGLHYHDFLNSSLLSSLSFVLKLRKKYDISINVYPSNRKEYNIISFLIGAAERGAVSYLRKDFPNLGFLNNVRVRENDELHNVEENIRICEQIIYEKIKDIPPLQFPLTKEDLIFAEKFLEERNIDRKDVLIGFHPGCAVLKNHIKRRWEPEKFAQLGKKLIDELGAKILIFGGSDEVELKNDVAGKINSDNAFTVDTPNLAVTAAIMKKCGIFITNDSSLMHIAAAFQIKAAAIIGPTSTNYIRPWQSEHRIISLNLDCSPCFYYSPRPLTCTRNDVKFKCIKELDTELVFEAVKELLI